MHTKEKDLSFSISACRPYLHVDGIAVGMKQIGDEAPSGNDGVNKGRSGCSMQPPCSKVATHLRAETCSCKRCWKCNYSDCLHMSGKSKAPTDISLTALCANMQPFWPNHQEMFPLSLASPLVFISGQGSGSRQRCSVKTYSRQVTSTLLETGIERQWKTTIKTLDPLGPQPTGRSCAGTNSPRPSLEHICMQLLF